jgi:hypothetical protein
MTYGVGIWMVFMEPSLSRFWYLTGVICLILAVAITFKVLFGYQSIEIEGGDWKVYRVLGKSQVVKSKDIEWWKETAIKTGFSIFKELHIHTINQQNVKINLQEHTAYTEILKLLKDKYRNKQIKHSNHSS